MSSQMTGTYNEFKDVAAQFTAPAIQYVLDKYGHGWVVAASINGVIVFYIYSTGGEATPLNPLEATFKSDFSGAKKVEAMAFGQVPQSGRGAT